jgi:hypothetical protein
MKKTFDCLKMKHDIQEQLHKETEGMSLDERFTYLTNKPLNNPKLENFVRKITGYHLQKINNSCVIAEHQVEYQVE